MWLVFNNLLKRIGDILFSLLALLVLSPVMAICAIWVKLDSKGPVIFSQNRLTKGGRIFKMMKFRSMVQDAEKQGAGLFNYEGDPRVTKCGRFLRDHSLDELPLLVHFLRGDMSFVGPRPCVDYELGDFSTLNKRYKKRFEVISGLTGYAQIQGRNELDWDVKVDFDNKYIDLYRKWGVAIDVYIIFKTMTNVLAHTDIYEKKISDNISNNMSAELAQNRVVELAHQPD